MFPQGSDALSLLHGRRGVREARPSGSGVWLLVGEKSGATTGLVCGTRFGVLPVAVRACTRARVRFAIPVRMRTRSEILSLLTKPGIIAVVRAQRLTQVVPMVEALVAGGVVATEITMTTPNALEAIRQACEKTGDRSLIGVGTVLDAETCRTALEAGAEFVVSPVCCVELVPIARAAGRPIMLGAYTPTEAQTVHEAGADFVKLFPADTVGPGYIRALRAPLPHLRIVPTGGFFVGKVSDFFKAGCAAVGVGSSLVSAQILKDGNWHELTRRAQEIVKAAAQAREI